MKDLTDSIIRTLQTDYRITIGKLATTNNVSPSTIRKYLTQLQTTAIQNYTIQINPNHIGDFRRIVVRIKTNPREANIVHLLKQHPQCQILQGITGEFSLFVLFQINSTMGFNHLVTFLDQNISSTSYQKYHLIELINTFKTHGTISPILNPLDKRNLLDNLDIQILHELQHQGPRRRTISDIARQLKHPQPTIFHRIEQLIQQGTIIKFTVDLKPNPTSFNTYLQLKVATDRITDLAIKLAQYPFITNLYRTSEDYALLAHINPPSINLLNQHLVQIYHDHPQVVDTNTTFILNTFMQKYFPLLQNGEFRENSY